MKNDNKIFSILSLICGICSVVFICCCPYITIPTGILAIVFAVLSKRERQTMDGLSKAGLICGIFGLAFCVLTIILYLIFSFTMGITENTIEFAPYYEEIIDEIELL